MSDPVIIETGISYERQYISEWFAAGHTTCPITNQGMHGTRKATRCIAPPFQRSTRSCSSPTCFSATKYASTTTNAMPPLRAPLPPSLPPPSRQHSPGSPAMQHKRHNSANISVTAVAGGAPPINGILADATRLVQALTPSGHAGNKTARKNAVAELYQLSALPIQAVQIVAAGGLTPLCQLLHEHSNTLNLLAASTLANIAAVDDAQRMAVDCAGSVRVMRTNTTCMQSLVGVCTVCTLRAGGTPRGAPG